MDKIICQLYDHYIIPDILILQDEFKTSSIQEFNRYVENNLKYFIEEYDLDNPSEMQYYATYSSEDDLVWDKDMKCFSLRVK